jgi:drug/metabolite transporter (DMT)-like permease
MTTDAKTQERRAFLSLACGMLIFPTVDALAKYLGRSMPVPQVLWARYLFQVVTLLPVVICLVPWKSWATVDYRRQVPQTLALLCAAGLYFLALRTISLAAAAMLFFLSPVYVILLARIILKERPSTRQLYAVGLGMLGALFILQPGYQNGIRIGSVLALCAGFANAVYLILVRRSRLAAPPLITAVTTGAIASVILSLFVPFVWQTPTATQWPLLVLIGFAGSAAQFCVIFAFQNGPAPKLAPMAFLELLSAMVISATVFEETPSVAQMAGAAIVLASVGLTINN